MFLKLRCKSDICQIENLVFENKNSFWQKAPMLLTPTWSYVRRQKRNLFSLHPHIWMTWSVQTLKHRQENPISRSTIALIHSKNMHVSIRTCKNCLFQRSQNSKDNCFFIIWSLETKPKKQTANPISYNKKMAYVTTYF